MSEDVAARVTPMRVVVAEEIRVLLARRIGATQPYMSRRLTGEIAFDVDDLDRIAGVLGVKPSDLLSATTEGTTRRYRQVAAPHRTSPAHVHPVNRKDETTRPPNRTNDPRRPVLFRGNPNG